MWTPHAVMRMAARLEGLVDTVGQEESSSPCSGNLESGTKEQRRRHIIACSLHGTGHKKSPAPELLDLPRPATGAFCCEACKRRQRNGHTMASKKVGATFRVMCISWQCQIRCSFLNLTLLDLADHRLVCQSVETALHLVSCCVVMGCRP